jgi:hypothetical protein
MRSKGSRCRQSRQPADTGAIEGAGRSEIIASLEPGVVEAFFWHASCNGQGNWPFRSQMRIAYPPSATFADTTTKDTREHVEPIALG